MQQTKLLIFKKSKKMKRKPKFLIAIASAIITIGVLFATVGKPKYFDKCHHKMECSKSVENK
jgi:hypothetical protein